MASGEQIGGIFYTVEADTAKLVNSTASVDSSLDRMNKRFDQTDKAAKQAGLQMTKTAAAVQGLGRESGATAGAMSNLARVLGGLLTLRAGNQLIQMAEGYREMAERIQMATRSQAEYELVQQRLLSTANGTYRSLAEAQEVYILTANSLRSMGYDTEQVLDITDSLSYAFVKNATSVERGANATRAYSNAIMKGRVEADGWSTIISAAPTIIEDIAAATGKSAEAIRTMGADGKLTARMLNEGLRQSLESNKAAADGMATTVRDAFMNLTNSLTVFLGESERVNTTTAMLSKSIIVIGENIETVASLLLATGAGALARYVAILGAKTVATLRDAVATREAAVAEIQLARQQVATATAALAETRGMQSNAATKALVTARTNALAAAQTRLAVASRVAGTAMGTLGSILGGPAGIAVLAASVAAGFLLMGRDAQKAVKDVGALTDGMRSLNKEMLDKRAQDAEEALAQFEKASSDAATAVRGLEKDWAGLVNHPGVDDKGLDNLRRTIVDARAELAMAREDADKARKALEELRKEQDRRAAGGKPDAPGKPGGGGGGGEASESQKRLQALRNEVELARLSGEARIRLQAIQSLGAKATEKERKEAAELAIEIERLNKLTQDREKLAQDGVAGAEENAQAIAGLAQQLGLAALSGLELAEAQAQLMLNNYATPEQIEQVRALARELYALDQQRTLKDRVGDDVVAYVRGNTDPLRGGAFDDHAARYEAEAEAERQRYVAQLERLREAMEAQKLTQEDYYKIFEDLAQTHANRMDQIDAARRSTMLGTYSEAFGGIADILKAAKGEHASAYRALFAVSKAFVVADTALQVYNTLAKAWNSAPFPANLPAVGMATVGALPLMAKVGSVAMSGRQYGGPVAAGKMYRINETGAPEVYNAANGQQFLLPNRRGQVISNKDATESEGSGAPIITLNVNNAPPGTTASARQISDREFILDVMVGDVLGDGRFARTNQGVFGLKRQGR